ncbi:hypothetical protein PX52LOC_05808 [Limnoglobus roseus]|uniref:Uncharacterized protein n=1 Tax=Limnoglobus roseus TaxID=2598579 RepID=A0A5C1AIT2_9BACT|nr:hypothetical protein PX52LOC_05808 [Limnoglobus roseus]
MRKQTKCWTCHTVPCYLVTDEMLSLWIKAKGKNLQGVRKDDCCLVHLLEDILL